MHLYIGFLYISSGAAPPIPATEPRIVCCSCVKRFRKTFRPVFSNSFFVCLWASEGLEFGPPGASWGGLLGVFLGLPAALGRSWAGLGRRGLFLSDFGCHLGSLLRSKIGLGTPQERQVDRFYPPGGSRGGSRRGSGRSFWGLFGG